MKLLIGFLSVIAVEALVDLASLQHFRLENMLKYSFDSFKAKSPKLPIVLTVSWAVGRVLAAT